MICPICHKPYAPRISIVMPNEMMRFCSPIGDVCHGLNFTMNTTAPILPLQPLNFRVPPLTITGQFDQWDGLRELLFSRLVELEQPEEEKPLEWSEVEAQLDDFMATLNRRNADD